MLKYSKMLPAYALRYLEFETFDEKEFLENFVEYLKTVFYRDDFVVEDKGQRKAPDGGVRPKYEIQFSTVPIFEIVSNNSNSCFIGATKRAKGLGIRNADAILDAYLNQYVQPKEYFSLHF